MRILITGATTALGEVLVSSLLEQAEVEHIIAVGREEQPPSLADGRILYRRLDLTRPRVLRELVWGDAVEQRSAVVVHLMQHRPSGDRGARVRAQNVEAAHELLLACQDHPTIRRFVYRSFAEVYAQGSPASNLTDEEQALDFDPTLPQWHRDRVEADLMMCSHLDGELEVAVLRCAEIMAPRTGSQLWDYLQSRVCMRPLGFDPMVNVLSIEDAAAALSAAARASATGVFNIPGRDTLPLSRVIAESGRSNIPVPGPLMSPLYALRRAVAGFQFRYDMNLRRFHFGGVLDGSKAKRHLGYVPRVPVQWPRSRWRRLFERLAETQQAP